MEKLFRYTFFFRKTNTQLQHNTTDMNRVWTPVLQFQLFLVKHMHTSCHFSGSIWGSRATVVIVIVLYINDSAVQVFIFLPLTYHYSLQQLCRSSANRNPCSKEFCISFAAHFNYPCAIGMFCVRCRRA